MPSGTLGKRFGASETETLPSSALSFFQNGVNTR